MCISVEITEELKNYDNFDNDYSTVLQLYRKEQCLFQKSSPSGNPNVLADFSKKTVEKMLTPAFELTQDEHFLKILIKAPFAKVSETEIFVEENDFKFFSKPYFLRLTLPGNIVEDGQEKAEYNADKGEFSLSFAKQIPGEMFEGLDMITKLLAPTGSSSASQPLIEVIGESIENTTDKTEDPETSSIDTNTDDTDKATTEEEWDWSIEQIPYQDLPTGLTGAKYGFANQKSGVFHRLQEELCELVDCPDPENTSPVQRREMRISAEDAKFDAEHYLGDFLEEDIIQSLIQYKPPWCVQLNSIEKGASLDKAVEMTDEEKDIMRKLPNKEYLLEEGEEKCVFLGLIDIMFAYAYHCRFTEGENSVEAGWNISKLSATLSWLEVFSNLQDTVVTCYRRCLCYPLYRNWKLCDQILQDVKHIFRLGRRSLLKCLLDVRRLLMDTDSRYILNDLYITDFCVWIQQTSQSKLHSLSEALQKIEIKKDEVGFNLVELEHLAMNAMDNNEIDSVTDGISDLKVNGNKDSDDDSTDTDSDESDDSETDDDFSESDNDESESVKNAGNDKMAKVKDINTQDIVKDINIKPYPDTKCLTLPN